jgi:hypothetical protein
MFNINLCNNRFSEKVAAIEQICSAVSPALHVVEGLALNLGRPSYMPDAFAGCSELWHALLRSFGTITTLWVDVVDGSPESFGFLNPDKEAGAEELLPLLSELVVVSTIDPVRNPFSSFIHARGVAGHPINFRTMKQWPFLPPLSILCSSDTFESEI